LFRRPRLYARNAWAQVHFIGAAPARASIEVTAQQFAWNFRYAALTEIRPDEA